MAENQTVSARPEPSIGPWREVVAGVRVLVAEPDSVNIGLITGQTGALVVDCGSSPAQGVAIRQAAERVSEVPLVAAVVTHAHYDHWFGLKAFADLITVGHESLEGEATRETTVAELGRLGLDADDLMVPSRSLSIVASVDLGGVRAEILHLGQGHSSSDVVIVVPELKVCFTGDLVEQPAPEFGEDSAPATWPGALNALLGALRPDYAVVPGHGSVVDLDFVRQQCADLSQVAFESQRLVREGVELEQAQSAGEWPFAWERVEPGVRRAYAELAAGRGRTKLPLRDSRMDLGE